MEALGPPWLWGQCEGTAELPPWWVGWWRPVALGRLFQPRCLLRCLNRGFVCLHLCSWLFAPEQILEDDPQPRFTLQTCPRLQLGPLGPLGSPAFCLLHSNWLLFSLLPPNPPSQPWPLNATRPPAQPPTSDFSSCRREMAEPGGGSTCQGAVALGRGWALKPLPGGELQSPAPREGCGLRDPSIRRECGQLWPQIVGQQIS